MNRPHAAADQREHPVSVVDALRDRGHDVLAVKESMRGADVLRNDQPRLALGAGKDRPMAGDDPDADIRRIVEVIDSRTDWPGQFAVATDDRIRMRPLPRRH